MISNDLHQTIPHTAYDVCNICNVHDLCEALHDLCLTVACAYRPGYLPNCKAQEGGGGGGHFSIDLSPPFVCLIQNLFPAPAGLRLGQGPGHIYQHSLLLQSSYPETYDDTILARRKLQRLLQRLWRRPEIIASETYYCLELKNYGILILTKVRI